ncbi:MAG TPA: thiamine diphosphokinase [Rectinemataceae bacterium]|nr:thiamine diphosphokinase [Rectinemataceae bacterium]
MKALIITGGECPTREFLRELAGEADIVIAADSGLDAAIRAEIEPDLVVGDFDSLEDRSGLASIPPDKIVRYPVEKDDTDTEIALAAARAKGADYLIVAGGGGGRLDHLLAVASLFSRSLPPREWHTLHESAYFLETGESAIFEVYPKSTVSVFPSRGEGSRGMSSLGLKWPLKHLRWERGYFGISNESEGERIAISAGTSSLLIILPGGCKRGLE